MNLNAWKYRYRRFRSLSLSDLTRRREIRLWRKELVKFVKAGRHPITDSNIDKWVNSRRISMGNGNLRVPGR